MADSQQQPVLGADEAVLAPPHHSLLLSPNEPTQHQHDCKHQLGQRRVNVLRVAGVG